MKTTPKITTEEKKKARDAMMLQGGVSTPTLQPAVTVSIVWRSHVHGGKKQASLKGVTRCTEQKAGNSVG
jgi:hypothetical protein